MLNRFFNVVMQATLLLTIFVLNILSPKNRVILYQVDSQRIGERARKSLSRIVLFGITL